VAFTIAIVASLESLLSIDAVDKLDPFRRITPLNKELRAQGIGNLVSGLIGGLPITSVIVRSSANVSAGARTKVSAISHGILLLLTAFLIPGILNKIPLSALAAILFMVGYKLAKPSIFLDAYNRGIDQFIPFIVTVIAILVSDLLVGIAIGMTLGLIFILKTNFHQALFSVNDKGNFLIRLTKDVSFLNKAVLRRTFREIPDNSYVIIDGSRSTFIDADILEAIEDFQKAALARNIVVELKQSVSASHPIFKA
jgi:MFS superfamily sulfate permease-like transporter